MGPTMRRVSVLECVCEAPPFRLVISAATRIFGSLPTIPAQLQQISLPGRLLEPARIFTRIAELAA
jgi:hypothetical protein